MLAPRQHDIVDEQDGVLGGDPHEHDQADHRRHRQGLLGDEQRQEGARHGEHQGRQNGHRLDEILEEQHEHDVDAEHPGRHGQAEALEEFAHRLGITDRGLENAGRQVAQAGLGERRFFDLAERLTAELDLEVDVAQSIVAIDLGRAAPQADLRHVAQPHRPTGPGHRQAFEQGEIGARRSRQTHDDGHLALGQIELGQALVVIARGRDTQGVGNRCRGHTEIGHAGEIRTNDHFRPHQAGRRGDIADARNAAQLALDLTRMLGQQRAVFTGQHEDVFLVGGAQPDLQLHAGNRHQRLAQGVLDILLGDAGTGIARRQVERQRGLADLGRPRRGKGIAARLAAADGGVDQFHMRVRLGNPARLLGCGQRLLEAAARGQGEINLGLRQIVRRQEAGRQIRHQREGAEEKAGRAEQRGQAMLQAPGRPAFIEGQPARRGMLGTHRTQDIGGHHRRQHARHDEGEKDGDGGGPPELDKEFARHTAHEGGRQKDGNQREGGGDHGKADFVRRLHGCFVGRLAHAQVAHDVFDLDDGIIDQDAHHERHRKQGHDIEREAHQVHRGKGRNGRQRQRGRRDKGGPAIAQEQPDDEHGQGRAFDEQTHRAFIVLDHRIDEIEGFRDLDIRMLGLQLAQRGEHGIGHLDLARALAARDFKADHRLAVEQRGRAPLGDGVLDPGNLIQADMSTVGEHDVHRGQFARLAHRGQRADRLLRPADISLAAGGFLLNAAQLARDVGCARVQGEQAGRVELDADLPRHAADARHRPDAAHAEQGLGHGVIDKPGERLLIHARRRHRVGQDGRAGEIDLAHHRVLEVARQIGTDARDCIAHIVDRFLSRFFQTELDGHGGRAVLHLGVDVLDALQGSDRVLDLLGHLGFHLRRRGAGQAGRHRHGGQVDVHELLDLHGLEGHQAGQGEQDEEQNRRNRIPDGPGGNVHHCAPVTT